MPKPIFKPNPHDYTKTSFLNWRFFKQDSPKSFLTLGEGYIKSSIELIAHVIENNDDKRADIFIFPILHNFNHGIELYLKGLVWTLNLLLKNNRGREGKHDIRQLYEILGAKIKNYKNGENTKYFNLSFAPLKFYIDELYSQTNGSQGNDQMDFSRYPIDKKESEHFYIVTGKNIEIDLIILLERFKEIYQILDQAGDFFYWIELKGDI